MNVELTSTLVTGSSGMVGSYVDFGVKTDHRSLDVTNLQEVRKVFRKTKPSIVLHLAAEVDFDRCETDITAAYNVNAVGTYNVATLAKEYNALMVYISTGAVFDGAKNEPYTESDEPNPTSAYGHSKYLGELAVRGLLDEYIIARISWVFGGGVEKDQKFIAKILKQLDKKSLHVVGDIHGSTTYGKDLVQGIKRLIKEERRGVFHMTNSGTPTRADIVREILRITNREDCINVEEVDQSFFGGEYVQRSRNESMVSTKGEYMRPWREALRDYIETEWPKTIKQ